MKPGDAWMRMGLISIAGAVLWTAASAEAQHNHGAAPSRAPVTTTPRPAGDTVEEERGRIVRLTITDDGFQPATIVVKSGERIRLVLLRQSKDVCKDIFMLDEFFVWTRLPVGKQVTETFVTSRVGDYPFACSSGAAAGTFRVE